MNTMKQIQFPKSMYKTYQSIDIEGPMEGVNGKMFFIVTFALPPRKIRIENTRNNYRQYDNVYVESKTHKKLFWEDTHNLMFKKAEECLDNGKQFKIKALRVSIQTPKKFHIVDELGQPAKKSDGSYRIASAITMFTMPDEDINGHLRKITEELTSNNLWITKVKTTTK